MNKSTFQKLCPSEICTGTLAKRTTAVCDLCPWPLRWNPAGQEGSTKKGSYRYRAQQVPNAPLKILAPRRQSPWGPGRMATRSVHSEAPCPLPLAAGDSVPNRPFSYQIFYTRVHRRRRPPPKCHRPVFYSTFKSLFHPFVQRPLFSLFGLSGNSTKNKPNFGEQV